MAEGSVIIPPELIELLKKLGLLAVREIAIPWLTDVFGDTWEGKRDEIFAITDPIFAEMAEAAIGEGLLGALFGAFLGDFDLARRLYRLRAPFEARATLALVTIGGLEPLR